MVDPFQALWRIIETNILVNLRIAFFKTEISELSAQPPYASPAAVDIAGNSIITRRATLAESCLDSLISPPPSCHLDNLFSGKLLLEFSVNFTDSESQLKVPNAPGI